MIFLLSDQISIRRKLFYIGLVMCFISFVLMSMLDLENDQDVHAIFWAIAVFIGSLCLVMISIWGYHLDQNYKKFGVFFLLSLSTFIPVIISIFIHLISIFSSLENLGERFVVENLARIIMISSPTIVVAMLLMKRRREKDDVKALGSVPFKRD